MKFHLSFACALIIFCACIGCLDQKKDRDKFFNLAQKTFENKKYDDSLVHLKNVLRIDPNFAPGYVLMGKIAFDRENYVQSKDNFFKAVSNAPDSIEANIGLAKSLIYLHQHENAKKNINKVFQLDPANDEVKFLQGIIYYHEEHFDESLKVLSSIPPDQRTTKEYYLLGQNYIKLNRLDDALNILNQGLDAPGTKNSIHFALGRIYESMKDFEKAAPHYAYLTDQAQDVDSYRYSLARFYVRTGQHQRARDVLRKLSQKTYDLEAIKALANIYVAENDLKNAEKSILEYENTYQDMDELKIFLIEFYITHNQLDKALSKIYHEIYSEDSVNTRNRYRKLLVTIFSIKKNPYKINEYMQEIIDEDPSDCDALIFFADEALLNGDIDQGIFQFRQVIHLEPHKDRAYVALAKLYMAQGNESMARQILQECIQNNNSPVAKIMLSQLFEKNDQLDDGIQQIRSIPGIYNSRLELFKRLIRLEIKNRNFSQVQKDLVTALEVESYKEFSIVALSKLFVLQGQFGKSHDLLDKYLKSNDQNPVLLEQKISVFIAQKDFSKALEYIDNHINDKSLQYYLKGNIFLTHNDIDNASRMYKKSYEMKNYRYVLMKLLHVYTESKQYDNAIDLALPYMDSHGDDFRMAFLLGYLYEHVNQYESALKFYQLALEKNPFFFPAVNNLAYLYANHFPTKKNLQTALSLIKQRGFSSDTQFLDTLGWVYVQMGHTEKAITLLETVVSRPDPSPLTCYHLGVAYMHGGQTRLSGLTRSEL